MHTSKDQTSFLSTRRGRLTLALVCLAGFLDFIDTTIVNVALPSIRQRVGFSEQSLQWVVSGYLLTYGGSLLLGGRASDLLGRRRLLIAGTSLFGLSSLISGLAASEWMLIVSRLAQGLGAAMMTPAALSTLTTSFTGSTDRVKAIGVWSATIPLASAVGVLAGGLLSEGPGWRWVFFVNVPVCAVVITGARKILPANRTEPIKDIDVLGAILPTASALTFVYSLVNAPSTGWGSPRTIAELAGSALLMAAFVVNERRRSNPLFPLSIFRIKGLAAADATQVIAQGGFLSLFFFITLYMQNVLHMSPIEAGAAYIPVTIGVGISSGISTQLLPGIGSRPLIVGGTLIGALGVFLLSRISPTGAYLADVLPGLSVMALGLGAVFVGVQNAANAGVPTEQAGLAAALISASSTLGGALGLAILSAISTSRTHHLLAAHAPRPAALTSGFGHALLACSLFLAAAAVIAARTANTRGQQAPSGEPAAALDAA
jgi:EmrB/QacA subfamily drug resistance transporter